MDENQMKKIDLSELYNSKQFKKELKEFEEECEAERLDRNTAVGGKEDRTGCVGCLLTPILFLLFITLLVISGALFGEFVFCSFLLGGLIFVWLIKGEI